MTPQAAAAGALDALAELIDAQRLALQQGRADELPTLSRAIYARLGVLAHVGPKSLDAGQLDRLAELRRVAAGNQLMLARRQGEAAAGLEVLGAASGHLQELQSRRTYAAAGQMASPLKGRTLGSA
jgi:hypothetical protein